ncbi:SAM-dependent methyltransferase [Palleronia sp. KMU-117]|uniref:SAM-dependent methyltransferase n=1 Tax=Palleronia sp. KMU-117 TaxID=3434108 RepID=UPI003D71C10F
MAGPHLLFDRAALRRQRTRAALTGPDLFLHVHLALLLEERLAEVNRSFTRSALVAPFLQPFSKLMPWAAAIADDELLDLQPEAHDLVVHAMALHWANDPVGQIVQARRALTPDGLFLGACLGGRTLSELRTALTEAEVRLTGGLSPRIAPMGEIRDLGALIQRAGLALPVADSLALTVEYRDALHLMRDLRAMGEGNALAARRRGIAPRALFADAARIYADRFALPNGRIPATFEFVFLTGWAPADSQPRPLRPGSAATRLADALGVDEHPAGDPADPAGNAPKV